MTDKPIKPSDGPVPPDSPAHSLPDTNTSAGSPDDSTRIHDPTSNVEETFPGFRVLRELGRGGQGVVYQAIQIRTKRKVAIKSIRANAFDSESALRRFQREIEVVAQLKHPNIIAILHADVMSDGQKFYAMEYVHGQPFDLYVRSHSLSDGQLIRLFEKVCSAVAYAHDRGVIHRDLKSDNILVDADGQPHILDFGLAKYLFGSPKTWASMSNQVVGTLPYMSPEQVGGSSSTIDVRTDVYALGVILFHALTGRFPIETNADIGAAINRILSGVHQRPTDIRPDIDGEIDTMVFKCLATDPERRYQSAGELSADIRNYIEGRPILAKRDSVAYLLRSRYRLFVRRQQAIAMIGVGVITLAIAIGLLNPLVRSWTPLEQVFSRIVSMRVPRETVQLPMAHVSVIELTDESNAPQLAAHEKLPEITRETPSSGRPLHGHLMKRLAAGLPRVVCWDIQFPVCTPYDAEFLEGVASLRSNGIPVVIAVRSWWADDLGRPQICQDFAGVTTFGNFSMDTSSPPWKIPTAMQRGVRDALPSLSLAAVAAFRRPDAEASYIIQSEQNNIAIRYRKSTAHAALIWDGEPDVVRVATVQNEAGDDEARGLMAGDRIAISLIDVPSDKVLSDIRRDYAAVMSASDDQLMQWFKGRAVFVADLRDGKDRFQFPGRAPIAGCYGHAEAANELLNQLTPQQIERASLTTLRHVDLAVCAMLGIVIGAFLRRGRHWAALACAAVLVGISAFAASTGQYLWNPIVPIATLLIATALAVRVRRQAMTTI